GGSMARRLSRRLGALLFGRACRDGVETRSRERHQSEEDRRRDDRVLRLVADRTGAPAAIRLRATQGQDPAAPRPTYGEPARLLSLAGLGLRVGRGQMGGARLALPQDLPQGRRGRNGAAYMDEALRPST